MTFVAPVAFGLAALAGPIVLLYMLRSRRARTPVPSTLLWQLGQRNVAANAPWQPLRPSLLLFLQLLALLLLVLAIARPSRATDLPLADHTVVIVDTSGSMGAIDGGSTRLDQAKAKALEAVRQLSAGKRMSVIDAGPQARVVLSGSTDRRALADAIEGLRASDGATDAEGAFALGASLETADVPTILHFYSDGGIRPEDRAISPAAIVHVPVGRPLGNVAVERVALAQQGGGWDAFVRASNTGTEAADATLELLADDALVLSLPVRLEPATANDLTLSIANTDAARLTARLTNVRAVSGGGGVNALAIDDRAQAMFERGTSLRVLLVSPGNVFLEALVRSLPGAELTVSKAAVPPRGKTLAIYDRVAPPSRLDVPSIVIAPPGGAPGIAVAGRVRHPVVTFVQPRERILTQVDLSHLQIRSAQVARSDALRTIVSAADVPLIALGVPGGVRMAYLSFDLRESNLPVQVAFPLLFGNLFDYLTRGDAPERGDLVAGDPLPLSLPGTADRLEVTTPDGRALERSTARALFDDTERAGFYTVRYLSGKEAVGEETFAVNVPAVESSLEPQRLVGHTDVRGGGARLAGLRSFGPGILAIALAVLLAEWWVSHGRPGPRRRYRHAGAAS